MRNLTTHESVCGILSSEWWPIANTRVTVMDDVQGGVGVWVNREPTE